MRYELTDDEWTAIKPMLPNKRRCVPRANDRPWRDLPSSFGPYTTSHNRGVRWRRAAVWAKSINAPAAPMTPPCR